MLYVVILLFIVIASIRLLFLKISIKNEKNLVAEGAIQYGIKTTKLIVIIHILAYFMFFSQGIVNVLENKIHFDNIFYLGIIIYLFSLLSLIIVIKSLKHFWTVKIYISPKHIKIDNFLFKYIKHPNYYFNIIPEIISIAMIYRAWESLSIILPIYIILLYIRIKQEEEALSSIK